MTNGIYFIANDAVLEQTIAMVKSVRLYEPAIAIILIPFDDNYHQVANYLEKYQVALFPNLKFIDEFTSCIREIFPEDFLALPNKMRKFVQWFGPLDNFIYIDTDIILFQDLGEIFTYLEEYEFVCCDYHHKGNKLKDIFTTVVKEENIFSDSQLADVFNSGFWASKKGIFTEPDLYQLLKHCAQHPEYFDFSSKTTDQPLLNYVILTATQKRLNLTKREVKEPGSWAGSSNFHTKLINNNYLLYDGEERLRYLHWAGIKIQPGCPYWKIWKHYRYLGESKFNPLLTFKNFFSGFKVDT